MLKYPHIHTHTHTNTNKDISPHQVTKVKGSEYVFMCIFILMCVYRARGSGVSITGKLPFPGEKQSRERQLKISQPQVISAQLVHCHAATSTFAPVGKSIYIHSDNLIKITISYY